MCLSLLGICSVVTAYGWSPALIDQDYRPEDARTPGVRATFQNHCVRCHGANGRGEPMRAALPEIPDFTNRTWQDSRKDVRLMGSILQGRGKSMPPFADRIGAGDARDLVALIRTFSRSPAKRGKPAADDFETSLRMLEAELEALKKEFRDLSRR
jgi:mono/diheme cytochrome c family protein